MAKKTSRNRQRRHQLQGEQSNACRQCNANIGETPNNQENKNNNPAGVIILGVSIRCERCAKEVLKCFYGFEGVEGIEIDFKNHKVSVKGTNADPIKVTERLRKKIGKPVELISPKPRTQKMKKELKPEEKTSRNRQTRHQLQGEQSSACRQCNANIGETPNNQENKNNNPAGVIILGVSIPCEQCADEVLKCLYGFEGVEGIEIDFKNHKVSVKGTNADPIKVTERLRKKIGKPVELISPKPKTQEMKKELKPEEPAVVEVVLKINIYCEGCSKEVKRCIHKMEGVQNVDPDMEKNLVTVTGTMDPHKLVEFINKRVGKHAEIVKQTIKENMIGQQHIQDKKGLPVAAIAILLLLLFYMASII